MRVGGGRPRGRLRGIQGVRAKFRPAFGQKRREREGQSKISKKYAENGVRAKKIFIKMASRFVYPVRPYWR